LVLVHLHDVIQALLQSSAVGGESDNGEDDVAAFASLVVGANLEYFRFESAVDIVTGNGPSVTGKKGKVGTADS
jgi:hypothetical protein